MMFRIRSIQEIYIRGISLKKLLLLIIFPINLFSQVNYDLTIGAEGYFHTNSDNKRWNYDYYSRKPMINVDFYGDIGEYFSYKVVLPIEKDRFLAEDPFDTKENYTNIVYDTGDIDFHIPKTSYIVVGEDRINLSIGRDRFKVGEGLVINDKVFYYDFIKLGSDLGSLSYRFNFLSLDDFDNEKYMITHSIGYSWEKVNLTILEGILLEGMGFDISYLNPFSILHNDFLAYENNANAVMSVNLEYRPVSIVNLYGELAVDQFATPYEEGRWEKKEPNALAWVVGTEFDFSLKDTFFKIDLSFKHSDSYYGIDSSGPAFTTTKKYVTRSQGDDIDKAEGIEVTDSVGFQPDREILTLVIEAHPKGKFSYKGKYSFERKGEVSPLIKNYIPGDPDVIHASTPSGDPLLIHTISGEVEYLFWDGFTGMVNISQLLGEEADTQFVISFEYKL